MVRFALLFAGALACGFAAMSDRLVAHEGHRHDSIAKSAYAFPLPPPGSYRLPPIKPAGAGIVLDESSRRHELASLLRGRLTVMAFIYTRCGDVCPTATLEMSRLQDLAARDRRVAGQTRLISMSFDPAHDTPAVMRQHAEQWRSSDPAAPAWLFLTTSDQVTLAPMLVAYNQPVKHKADPNAAGGPLHHLFRAFLIDHEGVVRNIYSLDFFDPQLVLNDLRTLILEYKNSLERPSQR